MADIDPALLAISDVLVLEALTRAWARTVKRSERSVPAAAQHNQYLRRPIAEERIDSVMTNAWAYCPLLADRHKLTIDLDRWMTALDGYTRSLLMAGINHTPDRLIDLLQHVPDFDPFEDDDARPN